MSAFGWWWAPPTDGQPAGGELDWLVDAPWGGFAIVFLLATVVLVVSRTLMRRNTSARGRYAKPDFDLAVTKLEALPITPIAEARPGGVHLVGMLRMGEGALGSGEHAQVYQNRAKASRATAIAAELVLLEDETGVVGLTELDAARVIAPKEERGAHDIIGLYLGDRVEVVGEMMGFEEPQTAGGRQLRGMLGTRGQIQVRVTARYEAVASPQHDSQTS